MVIDLRIIPRTDNENDVAWLLKTRRYISGSDVYQAYKEIYEIEPDGIPTVQEMVKVFKEAENRDIKITMKIVSHYFDECCVEQYLKRQETRILGIALAIEFRMLEKIISVAEDSDIFLYLTEYSLDEKELSLIIKHKLMDKLAERIVDKKKTMYLKLVKNFERLLRLRNYNFQDQNFVSKYINQAILYDRDTLLQYVLENFLHLHPLFEDMYCLAWDSFTKSRHYSHWLQASMRMNEISRYYQNINSNDNNINENKKYIQNYLKFKNIYSS